MKYNFIKVILNKYILLTKLAPTEVDSPEDLCELGNKVTKKLADHFSTKINWLANYAVCGPYDFVDVFEAETN